MKYYTYIECDELGDHEITLSEEEIINSYFELWSNKMKKIGKADQISHENCIDDWVVMHWAWDKEGFNNE
jgi:hypothetical protein